LSKNFKAPRPLFWALPEVACEQPWAVVVNLKKNQLPLGKY